MWSDWIPMEPTCSWKSLLARPTWLTQWSRVSSQLQAPPSSSAGPCFFTAATVSMAPTAIRLSISARCALCIHHKGWRKQRRQRRDHYGWRSDIHDSIKQPPLTEAVECKDTSVSLLVCSCCRCCCFGTNIFIAGLQHLQSTQFPEQIFWENLSTSSLFSAVCLKASLIFRCSTGKVSKVTIVWKRAKNVFF